MHRKGMSVFEIVATLAIFGIMAGFAAIPLVNPAPKYRLLKAVREIHSRMNYARYKAICTGSKVRLRFEPDGFRTETWDEANSQWIPGPKEFVKGAAVEANNTPTFHPVGTVSNLCTINISNTWGYFKLSLAISGRIKITQVDPPPD